MTRLSAAFARDHAALVCFIARGGGGATDLDALVDAPLGEVC